MLNKSLILTIALASLAGCTANETRPVADSDIEPSLSFVDVAAEVGLSDFRHITGARGDKWFPETMGSGGGFVDYNNDGWMDIILVGGGQLHDPRDVDVRKLWLYENQEGRSFKLQPETTLPAQLSGYGFGILAGDYDNDGDDDIFFTTLGPNHLLRNNGGVFEDVTVEAGLSGPNEWSTSAIFFDANNDGFLDLFVGNYVNWSPEKDLFCSLDGEQKAYCTPQLYEGVPGRFYLNNGDGTFADQSVAAGFSNGGGKNLGVSSFDFNRDNWIDLVVANDTDPDQLFQNNGDGTFEEIGVISGIAFDERGRARAGMGIDTGVVDSSGEETIFVGNFSNQMIGVYRHLNDSVFLDRAASSQIGRSSMLTLTFGLFLLDIDLDGDLDLFAANGHVQPSIELIKDNVTFRQPSHLFLNDGDGTFSDIAGPRGEILTDSLVSRGAAYADYDNDGDLDILVTENGGGVLLYRNDLSERNYLRLKLSGTSSNASGIGATATLYKDGQSQARRVRTGSSFLSQSELILTFGLGQESKIDSVIVTWPSGKVSRISDVDGNQVVTIVEPES